MKKRLCSFLLALSLAAGLAIPAAAEESAPIVILHTNDVHCAVELYPAVAAQKTRLEEQYGEDRVTLVDVGDAIQGGAIGTLSTGAYPLALMNTVGYDLAIPGNHEFDFGMAQFLSLAREKAQFPYLCVNFTGPEGAVLDPYRILDYGDVQIAYVGIATPETIGSSTPTHFQDGQGNYIYSFLEDPTGQALYGAVQSAVDAARAEGADYVVALGHLGVTESTPAWSSAAVIANTTGIDIFLDGHSHEQFQHQVENQAGELVCLVQTGTKLAQLGCLLLDPETGAVTPAPIDLSDSSLPRDGAVEEQLANIQAMYRDLLAQKAGITETDLIAAHADGSWAVRSAETNLGNLVADAYRIQMGADVGLVNGGGVRANIPAGEITYGDLLNVQPFANELCLVEVSGQELLDLLEHSVRSWPEPNGSFLQVSGVVFSFDPSVPSSAVINERDEFLGVEGPYRVYDVKVGGQSLDLDRTYTLASHNYMIKSGGSGGTQLQDNNLLLDCVMLDSQALMDYVAHTLGGVVGEDYALPAGRITPAEAPEEAVPAFCLVRPGDCLWSLAKTHLGSGLRWQEIYRLNRHILSDPNRIYPGQELLLPAA